MGLTTLVGQSLGGNDVAAALRFIRQTTLILMAYTLLLDLLLLLAPHWLIELSLTAEGGADYQLLPEQGVVAIRIMALLIAFDALYFTFVGVLKGAGDTRFIMGRIGLATLLVMVLPMTVIVEYTGCGLYACWLNLTVYVITLFGATVWRFRQGKWKTIRVI